MTDDVFGSAEHRMRRAIEYLQKDFGAIRAGRAHPALLEKITVDYYGTPTPLTSLAGISTPEPRLLVVQPWDRSVITAIEKAIQKSDLGLNPSSDGSVIRLAIPQLTEDRRKELVKQVHRRAEEGRVAVRNIRREKQDDLKKSEKDKQISEDELKRATDRLQKLTDSFVAQIEDAAKRKEQEVLEV
ncbi:MAG: ribosome recycling factor [Chloroflexi bacterium]|nr:ribosome recycling factor [Chloroflexota bacterium]